jgi:ribonuclease-3
METGFEKDVRMFLAKPPFCLRGISNEDLQLFCTALTHDSYSNEMRDADPPQNVASYERLEFLGDAIVEFLVCEMAFNDPELADEGEMTDFKQDAVANRRMSERIVEKGVDIDGIMRVGGGHINQDRTKDIAENMRADCFEALVAATYLAYGMDTAREIVSRMLHERKETPLL